MKDWTEPADTVSGHKTKFCVGHGFGALEIEHCDTAQHQGNALNEDIWENCAYASEKKKLLKELGINEEAFTLEEQMLERQAAEGETR